MSTITGGALAVNIKVPDVTFQPDEKVDVREEIRPEVGKGSGIISSLPLLCHLKMYIISNHLYVVLYEINSNLISNPFPDLFFLNIII